MLELETGGNVRLEEMKEGAKGQACSIMKQIIGNKLGPSSCSEDQHKITK